MTNLRPYTLVIGGLEHTVLLSAEDAASYGDAARPVEPEGKPVKSRARK